MLTWLTDPLQLEFMRQAIAIAVLLGILCAITGSYLIVQQMGMMGHVISHSILPGLSIAFFFQIDLAIGAFIAGSLSALSVAWIHSQSRVKADAAMALVVSGFLALGVMLITLLNTTQLNLDEILFGNILGVTSRDLWQTLGITLLVVILVKLFYKELLFYTFDPLGAQACGLPITGLYLGLIAVITLTVIASIQTVGVLLVIALLIAPSTTAYLLVKELHWMMITAAIIGIISGVGGMYLSYYANVPSGPAIVLLGIGCFLLAFLFSPSQGIVTRPESRHRLVVFFHRLVNRLVTANKFTAKK
ncbi:MAG: metal ABC transporter permease [Cyanobacteria bacterium]|nr:metal ABC transporter permease [Cyanobacteriota bacterium]MDW8201195.1 metal ABC transporter permease [Cyanobacteriota bacterium SKYGB_h_bin112]